MSRAAFSAALVVASLAGSLPIGEARAQSNDAPTEYRVEVLVVEPVDGRSDDWPVDAPGRFDGALDPRVVAEAGPLLAPAWSALAAPGVPIPQPLAERTGRVALDESEDDSDAGTPDEAYRTLTRPAMFAALEPLPAGLAELRERVADSGEFEPVTALAWLQPAGRPRRPGPIRVHDDVVVDRRPVPPTNPDRVAREAESPVRSPVDRRNAAIDSNERLVPPEGSARTGPAFRLDGSLALVRRQFLHAELDLHWQTPVRRLGELRPGVDSMRLAPNDAGSADGWRVHRLRQSRVIRPDRWEYFDSERFGVLLRVTELDPLLPLPPPEPPPAVDGGIDAGPRPQSGAPSPDTAEPARGR
ncbi:CsiV family protein [Halomonas denitrificans]|nr:peptidoglycan binding protein CsiV [Halomonas denitrificans]